MDHLDTSTLLQKVVRALVDNPSSIRIEELRDGDSLIYRLHSHPSDTGKLIGKNGRTARSLRVILAAVGVRLKRKFLLDIVDHARPDRIRAYGDDGGAI